jgi:hypothetical protein
LPVDQRTQPLSGRVQRSADRVQLGDPAALGTGGEVAVPQPLGAGHQQLQRSGQAAGLPTGHQPGQHDRHRGQSRHGRPGPGDAQPDTGVVAGRADHAGEAVTGRDRHRDDLLTGDVVGAGHPSVGERLARRCVDPGRPPAADPGAARVVEADGDVALAAHQVSGRLPDGQVEGHRDGSGSPNTVVASTAARTARATMRLRMPAPLRRVGHRGRSSR